MTPRFDIKKYQFPGYDFGPKDFPYDDLNIQNMKNQYKLGTKKLTSGKNPFQQDFRVGQDRRRRKALAI